MRSQSLSLIAVLILALASASPSAQSKAKAAPPQKIDAEYTRLIKEYLQDPRITTELVDHLPASDTVPSPLAFFKRIVGTPGELTYAKDIYRYYEALAKAAPSRAKYWKVGTTEEGRDIVLLAIADEATIKSLDKYRDMLGELTDPRRTSEARAQQLLHTAKPIYYAISGMHSPETGGPEMLIELAYRLIVEETPFVQNIRSNVITLITPVIEVDGREKQVDTYYFNKKRAPGRCAAAVDVLGQVRPARQQSRRHGAVPQADAGRHQGNARVAPDGDSRSARGADLPLRVDRHRSLQQRASIRSSSTSGGCSPRTT